MFDISPIQIVLVLAIALLIFGPKRLPEMGRDLGRGIRDFKGGRTGEDPSPPAARWPPLPPSRHPWRATRPRGPDRLPSPRRNR
jgi:sec-independent protein translocase protein TatA